MAKRTDNAVVVNEDDREAAKTEAIWNSLKTFYMAPCLWRSVGTGAAGGVGIGMLRRLSGSPGRTAFTWGGTVGGLLAGCSWFVCRRPMYMQVQQDATLLARAQAGDAAALREYQAKLERKAARMTRKPEE